MSKAQSSQGDPEAEVSDLCVLIVEDDEIMRLSLEDRLRLEGIPVKVAFDVASAQSQLQKGDVDIVVTDIRLPDGSGADLFHEISQHYPGTPVILMTAFGEVSDAVALVKAGALDYLTKPFDLQDFIEKIQRNLSRIQDKKLSADSLGFDGQTFRPGSGMLGKSSSMRRIERLVARLASVDSSVLITGSSGVGKEVVASLLHSNSLRANKPFIRVNCAALPQNLIESELFGHEKGSFTGATNRHIGRFEKANTGSIFLDEIAEIPPETQVKLLRVLQEQLVDRVGGKEPVPLDVRIIAATQVDLEEAIRDGRFRSDLYWRLNVINVHIPDLKDRREDILFLARMFVERHATEMGIPPKRLSVEAEARLMSMPFPGNVRELRNILERAVALSDAPRIMAHDLMLLDEDHDDLTSPHTLRASVESAERQAIHQALIQSGWAIGQAADELGISRKNLWEKMKRYTIEKD
jgi:two-component system response regulator AtoC